MGLTTMNEEDEACQDKIEEWEEERHRKSMMNEDKKTTYKRKKEDDLTVCYEARKEDKKLKYNRIEEGCWGEVIVGLVKVDGVPQPYQPLPQRKVDRRGRRGCIMGQLTRHKPGIFTAQDIRIFLKPKPRVVVKDSLVGPNTEEELGTFEDRQEQVKKKNKTKFDEEDTTVVHKGDTEEKKSPQNKSEDRIYEEETTESTPPSVKSEQQKMRKYDDISRSSSFKRRRE